MADRNVLDCLAKKEVNVNNFGGEGTDGKPFYDWFKENVLGLDTEEYRRTFWREVHTKGHTIGHMPRGLETYIREHTMCRQEHTAILFWVLCLMGCSLAFWVLRRQLDLILRRMRRSSYYERERGRRLMLADLRKAVTVRRTPNRMPTVDELRMAFARANDSPEDSLRFGAMLEDLEGYVDNHVLVDSETGEVRGRMGGIKRFLEREAPDLFKRYKSVMSHKARAKRFRQACDAVDPVPVDALLPLRPPCAGEQATTYTGVAIPVGSGDSTAGDRMQGGKTIDGLVFPCWGVLRDVGRLADWMREHGNTDYLRTRKWLRRPVVNYSACNLVRDASLELAAEVLNFCDGTLVSLDAAIALKIDPDCMRENAEPDARVTVLRAEKTRPRVSGHLRRWFARQRDAANRKTG